MDNLGLDLNEIIKSAYSTVMEVQQAATEIVGIKCIWARATPVINSEDIVLQESIWRTVLFLFRFLRNI